MAVWDKLLGYFNLTTITKGNSTIPYPAKKDPKTNLPTRKSVKYTGDIERYIEMYMNQVFENASSVRNRMDRYNALDEMVKNDGYMNIAVEMFAYEATQADAQNNIINIEAEPKIKKRIQELFDRIGLSEQMIQDVAYNVSLFGDSFWVHDINEKGIVGVLPISPYSVSDRLEFNPVQIQQELKKRGQGIYNLYKSSNLMQKLAGYITNKKETFNLSDYFRSYLFGFSVNDGDMVLPPWMITHFKRYTTQNEFAPFGRPLFINSLSPYRQLQNAKILQATMRSQAFPIKIWEIEVSEDSNAMDSWNAVDEFKAELENLGRSQSDKEMNVGGAIFMPANQAKLTIEDSRIDLNKIADIENLEQNMITSTGIPPSAILAGQGGFGNSGDAMLRQDKKFARRVYSIQTAILESLVDLIHLDFILVGDFDYTTTKFELSMNFPVEEESSDKMRTKSDSLRLANDIISNLGTALGLDRGEALPPEVVRQVFSQYSFLDSVNVDEWVTSVENMRSSSGEMGETTKSKFVNRAKRLTEKECYDAYFEAKEKNRFREGTISGYHYYTAKNINKDKSYIYEVLTTNYTQGSRLTEEVNWKK